MNKWIENRIEELTEQRRAELAEYFDEYEWAGDLGEAEEERLSLYYGEEYIPERIEALMYEDGWDEDFVKALYDVNFDHAIQFLKNSWDEIETKYPEYFEDIKAFFEPFVQEYDEAFQKAHDNALEEYVTYTVEQEAESIQEQTEEEYRAENQNDVLPNTACIQEQTEDGDETD